MSTAIEWTDEVWNPVTGCSKVSEGCRNCYAEGVDRRFGAIFGHDHKEWTSANAEYNVRLHTERITHPLGWKKPRRVFVNSMSDLFHEQVPFEFIASVWAIMWRTPQHTYQILTKRPQRMLEFFQWHKGQQSVSDNEATIIHPLPNVWLGVSVENQQAADERIPLLLETPAAVRFLSCEPLLGPVDLLKHDDILCRCEGCMSMAKEYPENPMFQRIDWVIVGGESGAGARPMHPDWARDIRDQCTANEVPFFFKQWGEYAPYVDENKYTHGRAETTGNAQCYINLDGSTGYCWIYDDDGSWTNWTGHPDEGLCVVNRVGKKKTGRLLDGCMWEEYPKVYQLLEVDTKGGASDGQKCCSATQ